MFLQFFQLHLSATITRSSLNSTLNAAVYALCTACQQQSHDHLSTPHSTPLCMHYALPVSNNHTITSQLHTQHCYVCIMHCLSATITRSTSQLHTQHCYVCIMHCLSATITRSPLNSTLNTAMYALCIACQQQSHDHLSTPHSTLLCMHYALLHFTHLLYTDIAMIL